MPRSRRPFAAHDYLRLQACSDPQLAPDRSALAWVRTWADPSRNCHQTQLMLTSLVNGTSQALTTGPLVAAQPRWSPDGQTLAYVAAKPRSSAPQLYLIPAAGGTPRQGTAIRGGVLQPIWSPDAQSISLLALLYPPPPPPPPGAALYERFTRDILVTQQPLAAEQPWGQPSHRVVVKLHGEPKLSSSPNQHAAAAAPPPQGWPTIGDQIMLAAAAHAQGQARVALLADQLNPGDLYLLDAHNPPQRLTTLNAALLNELMLAPCLHFSHGTQQGWVIAPQGYATGQRYPAILDLRPHPPSFKPAWQYYAAQGYVVICGSGVARQDALAFVAAACARYSFIDPKRLAIIGGPDVVHMSEQWPESPLIADCRQQTLIAADREPKAKPRATLVLATSNNHSGEQLYTSLGQRGVPVELIRFPASNHPLLPALRPWHQVFALERCLAWLREA